MSKKLFLSALLLFAFGTSAFAALPLELWVTHQSIADITDGKLDFSNARYLGVFFAPHDGDHEIPADKNLKGTMDIWGGGAFSVIEHRLPKVITSGSYTFDLIDEGSEYAAFNISYDGEEGNFVFGNDGALNGANVSWNFPTRQEFNGSTTLPNYKTTNEQLADIVPYIEFITDASGNATGLTWRVVNPDDLETPVSKDFPMRLTVASVRKTGNALVHSGSNHYINSGETPEGTETFDKSVPLNEISNILLRLRITSGDEQPIYTWRFYDTSKNGVVFWCKQVNRASLIEGKANYDEAKFSHMVFDIYDIDNPAEGSSFVEGEMTVPGVGYTLVNDVTANSIGVNISAGQEKKFPLKMYYDVAIGWYYCEYEPYSGDIALGFGGSNAETGFNGKTIKFDLPDELGMDTTVKVPNFKSVNAQLNSFVPYVEVVSADGKATAIKYKLAKASDTSTSVTADVDLILYYYPKDDDSFNSSWKNSEAGTWTFDTPQDINNLNYISFSVRPSNPSNIEQIYQWKFYPAEKKTEPTPEPTPTPAPSNGGGGGGCDIGLRDFTLYGILLIGAAIKIFGLIKH